MARLAFGAFEPGGNGDVGQAARRVAAAGTVAAVLGFHIWAVALPQALEGMPTILVPYRAARRLGRLDGGHRGGYG